jgi:hypothetical protein
MSTLVTVPARERMRKDVGDAGIPCGWKKPDSGLTLRRLPRNSERLDGLKASPGRGRIELSDGSSNGRKWTVAVEVDRDRVP